MVGAGGEGRGAGGDRDARLGQKALFDRGGIVPGKQEENMPRRVLLAEACRLCFAPAA